MNKDQKVKYINMIVRGVAIVTGLKEESENEELLKRADKILADLNDMLVILILTEEHPEAFIQALDNVEYTINEIEKHTQSL